MFSLLRLLAWVVLCWTGGREETRQAKSWARAGRSIPFSSARYWGRIFHDKSDPLRNLTSEAEYVLPVEATRRVREITKGAKDDNTTLLVC
jgi:hypothetical protein